MSASQTSATLPLVQLTAFEGPLDLLLHLVRQGRMDIFDLPIASLCDQFLAHLAAMDALNLNIAGDFLVMAATLLEIKSRLLLPRPPVETVEECEGAGISPDDPRAELVQRLLEYGRFQTLAENLRTAEYDRQSLFFRPTADFRSLYSLPPRFGEMAAADLMRTLERILADVGAGERAVTSVRRQKITLRMTMRATLGVAEKAGGAGIALAQLIPEPPFALLEIVLLFLALLELLKQGSLIVAQEDFCGEIRVFFVPEAERSSLISNTEEGIILEAESVDK